MAYIYTTSQAHERVISVEGLTTTETAGDGDINYVIRVDNVNYWYDTGWQQSLMTTVTANTLVDLIAQLATLPVNTILGSTVSFIAVIEYTDKLDTGSVDSMQLDLITQDEIQPMKTRVLVDTMKLTGETLGGTTIRASLAPSSKLTQAIKYRGEFVIPTTVVETTDKYGKVVLELPGNDMLTPVNTFWAISIGTISTTNYALPTVYEVDLSTL